MMGFRCVLFILGLSSVPSIVVTPVFGNVCISDLAQQTVVIEDGDC